MPPRENPQSVTNWINWLNTNFGPGPWIPLSGHKSYVEMQYDLSGTPIFNPSLGFPVKLFWNQATGEIKAFDARKFF